MNSKQNPTSGARNSAKSSLAAAPVRPARLERRNERVDKNADGRLTTDQNLKKVSMKRRFIASTLALGFISLCASEALANDSQAPTALVTAPTNGSAFKASAVPSSFTGTVADNGGGGGNTVGLNASSTKFTLQR